MGSKFLYQLLLNDLNINIAKGIGIQNSGVLFFIKSKRQPEHFGGRQIYWTMFSVNERMAFISLYNSIQIYRINRV